MKALKAVFLVTLASAGACVAGTFTYDGDTTGQPVWNRPTPNGNLPPQPPPSFFATAVPYQTVPFTVSQFGTYEFRSDTSVFPPTPVWDNEGFLYAGTFDAAQPMANVLIGNDEFPPNQQPIPGLVGFSYDLNPGTPYYFVSTGYENTDFGPYRLTIRGPGDIIPVPEPGQIAMMALTILGAAGYAVRRYRSSK
jgi:hypothetical protein